MTKKCKSCQSEIDIKAKKCPKCRADQRGWFKRHPILTGLLILIFIGIIGSAAGGSKDSSTSSGSKTNAGSDQANLAKVGEAVTDEDLSFTVVSVDKEKTVGNSYTQKNAQGMFYIVTLKLENAGKKTVTFDSSMAKVVDSEGREYERSIDGQTAKGMSEGNVDLFLQQIQPTLSYTGDLVFDLPETIKDPTLVVKGSMFSKGAKVKLQ